MDESTFQRLMLGSASLMASLTNDCGEKTRLSDEECQTLFAQIEALPPYANTFFIVLNIKKVEVVKEYNVGLHLDVKGRVNFEKMLRAVKPELLEDYLRWGGAAYSYAATPGIRQILEPLKQTYRIMVPMLTVKQHYAWVLQESRALELDADSRLISHLNIYTVLRAYDDSEIIGLVGDVWDDGFEQVVWSRTLQEYAFKVRPFLLTKSETRTLDAVATNPHFTNSQTAALLGKSIYTVEEQNKAMLAKARGAFPAKQLRNVKDLADFLRVIGWFEKRSDNKVTS